MGPKQFSCPLIGPQMGLQKLQAQPQSASNNHSPRNARFIANHSTATLLQPLRVSRDDEHPPQWASVTHPGRVPGDQAQTSSHKLAKNDVTSMHMRRRRYIERVVGVWLRKRLEKRSSSFLACLRRTFYPVQASGNYPVNKPDRLEEWKTGGWIRSFQVDLGWPNARGDKPSLMIRSGRNERVLMESSACMSAVWIWICCHLSENAFQFLAKITDRDLFYTGYMDAIQQERRHFKNCFHLSFGKSVSFVVLCELAGFPTSGAYFPK